MNKLVLAVLAAFVLFTAAPALAAVPTGSGG